MTSGLVYPPLGISFNEDPTVSIFMSEQDLQRLKANWATKQETAPPPIPAATSGRGKQVAAVHALRLRKFFQMASRLECLNRRETTRFGQSFATPLPDKRTIKRALKGSKGTASVLAAICREPPRVLPPNAAYCREIRGRE